MHTDGRHHACILMYRTLLWSSSVITGKCIYPVATFGPIAMYGSDFRAVGGMADANSGRWGYEDTAFLHKVGWVGYCSVPSRKAFLSRGEIILLLYLVRLDNSNICWVSISSWKASLCLANNSIMDDVHFFRGVMRYYYSLYLILHKISGNNRKASLRDTESAKREKKKVGEKGFLGYHVVPFFFFPCACT